MVGIRDLGECTREGMNGVVGWRCEHIWCHKNWTVGVVKLLSLGRDNGWLFLPIVVLLLGSSLALRALISSVTWLPAYMAIGFVDSISCDSVVRIAAADMEVLGGLVSMENDP